MSSEWKEVHLQDLVTLKRGYDLPKADRLDGEFPILASNGITGFHNDFKVKGPGIVTGRSGTLGEVIFINGDFWPLNTTLYGKEFHGNDIKFVYYFLKTLHLENYNSGSSVPTLNRNHIHSLPVKIPCKHEQYKIGLTLSSLDDKIELNKAINKNLEEMAQALFKRWFINFEFPNEDGEPYKSSGGEFEESELGLIPKGWCSGHLGDIALPRKKSIKPENILHGTKYVGLEHVDRKSLSLSTYGDAITVESNKTVFNEGDVLFGKLRPYFHKVSLAPFDGVCSTDILAIYPKKEFYYGLTVFHIFSDELVNTATSSSNGTRMPRTNWSTLSNFPIVIPEEQICEHFTSIINSVLMQMKNNIFESANLKQLRDSLLPKLMSGEIRVPIDEQEQVSNN